MTFGGVEGPSAYPSLWLLLVFRVMMLPVLPARDFDGANPSSLVASLMLASVMRTSGATGALTLWMKLQDEANRQLPLVKKGQGRAVERHDETLCVQTWLFVERLTFYFPWWILEVAHRCHLYSFMGR